MYDLDRKLLDLNNQILSYRIAMNKSLDSSFSNPLAPPIVQPSQHKAIEAIESSKQVEDKVETPIEVPSQKPTRGPRGKRGKRGPKGDSGAPGKDGRDFDASTFLFNTNLVHTNYSVSKTDCFLLIRAKENIDIVISEDMQDGKLLIFKNDSDSDVVITIKTEDGAMIDGDFSVEMNRPNETLILICKGGDWFIL